MNIGIIGAGHIGSALAAHFQNLKHEVRIANSRGPSTLTGVSNNTGAVAVDIREVAQGAELLVVSIPVYGVPSLSKELFQSTPTHVPVIDTGNYYPQRDGVIKQIEDGLTESEWTSQILGRTIVKAFNNISSSSLIHGGLPVGAVNRISLPIAGDDVTAKKVVISLVEAMGFDGVDAGPLSESWRQEPGSRVYGTDYGHTELQDALAKADRSLSPKMRDVCLRKLQTIPAGTPPERTVHLLRSLWSVWDMA